MNDDSKTIHHESSTTVVHIGDYLKREREAIKVSIEKVSQKTKINLNILKSLEANDFKSLPSPAYVKGFVLSYARVLGLSPEDVINKLEYSYLTIVGKPFPALNYSKNTEPLQINPEFNDPAKVLEDEKKLENRKKLFLPVTLGISVVLGVVGLYNLLTGTIKKEIKSTQTNEVPTAPITVEAQPVSEPIAPVVNGSVQSKPVMAEATKVEVPKELAKPTTAVVSAPKVVEEIKPSPPKEVVSATKPEEKPPLDPSKRIFPPKDFRKINLKLFAYQDGDEATMSLLSDETKSKFDGTQENIYINAVDGDTWLSYKVDEKKIESVSIKKGEGLFLQGKKVLIFFGNVKATRIFYQNKLIDAPTPTGFKSLIFPESETKKHMLPLFPKASNDTLYTAEEYIKRMTEEEKQVSN
jgi:cytoskeletal protein RodZ